MADKPTAQEIGRMRWKHGRWVGRDRRISRLAFEFRLKRVGDACGERAGTMAA